MHGTREKKSKELKNFKKLSIQQHAQTCIDKEESMAKKSTKWVGRGIHSALSNRGLLPFQHQLFFNLRASLFLTKT